MEWINVNHSLPERDQKVLCKDKYTTWTKWFSGEPHGIFYDNETYCYCPVGKVSPDY